MKVIGPLAFALLMAACSNGPDAERRSPPPPPEQAPAQPAADRERQPRVAGPSPQQDARAAAAGPVTRAATRAGANPDAAVLQDFKTRVDRYVALHKEAANGAAKLKETDEPAEIAKSQDALAARIRVARADAKHGDIFTAEVRHAFRRLLAPEMKGEEGRDAKAVMKDDAPAPSAIPFKVNAKYPEGQPLPTVPPSVLLNLPKLPEPLEYRIIGRHLVLLDSDADLIVDYIPNAIA